MREELDRHFRERFFAWAPYVYQELADVDEAQERALIEAGAIQAMGFRYIGVAVKRRNADAGAG